MDTVLPWSERFNHFYSNRLKQDGNSIRKEEIKKK